MANSLIKDKKFTPAVIGRSYRPALPARDVFETTTVCGYRFVGKGDGHYEYIRDPSTGATTAVWIPAVGSSAGQSSGSYTYACWTETVLVHYPAQTEQTAIAESPAHFDYRLGWNAGARSAMFVTDDAYAIFHARASMVGAICGLTGYEDPLVYNGTSIKFGFSLTHGLAKVIEQGVIKTAAYPYTDASVFKVNRADGQITYLIDNVLVYTSAVSDSTEPLWLQSALYSADDEIFDPELHQVDALDPSDTVTGTLALKLPPPAAALRVGDGAVLRLALPQPEPALVTGLAAPSYALLSLALPPLVPAINSLVGAVGQLQLDLSPPRMFAADSKTGRLRLTLPELAAFARSYPYDTLPGGDTRLFTDGRISAFAEAVLPTQPLVALLGVSGIPYGEVTLGKVSIAGILGGNMAAQGEVTLRTVPIVAVLGGEISVLSGLGELWVMNLTAGQPGGTTQYEGYEFNSFALIGGRYYGARHDGLFLLEGEDDAGADIEASFGLGQINFGNAQKKTVAHCYLGAAAGALELSVDALLNDTPANYAYEARGHGDTMREVRFDLGKALKSTYIVPTFTNQDGDAFKVDTVQFLVHDLDRKI